jgi:hypothetical protein
MTSSVARDPEPDHQESEEPLSAVVTTRPYRVKLVIHHADSCDNHYFYAETPEEAREIRDTICTEIGIVPNAKVWIYKETSLGHVRVL